MDSIKNAIGGGSNTQGGAAAPQGGQKPDIVDKGE